jgi:transcriptional regulator with XRE-family HTH domain
MDSQLQGRPGTPELSRLVRERRQALGMTQDELAERIGKSRTFIRNIEVAQKAVTNEDTIQALAEALQSDPYELYAAQHMVPHDLARLIGAMDFVTMYETRAALSTIT